MSGRFANREVCDLIISDYATQEPLLFCDYANTNSTELTSESVHAFGGWGHPKRIGFNGERGGTLTVETQLQSFQLWKMLTGGVATVGKNQADVDNITVAWDNGTTGTVTVDNKKRGLTIQRESGSGSCTVSFNGMSAIKGAVYICRMHVKHDAAVPEDMQLEVPGGGWMYESASDAFDGYRTSECMIATDNGEMSFRVSVGSNWPLEISELYIGEAACLVRRELSTANNMGRVVLKNQPVADSVTVFAANDDNGTILTSYTISGSVISGTDITAGNAYIVYYTAYVATGSQRLNIKSTTFPKAVSISAFTYNKSENDEILPYQMRVYKAHPQANLTLQNSNTGDPVTLTMTFDLLADKANNMLDLILMDDIPEDVPYISVTAEPGKIVLNWPASRGATGYRMSKKVGAGGYVLFETNYQSTVYEDTNVVAGTQYGYAVRPINSNGTAINSTVSPIVTAI